MEWIKQIKETYEEELLAKENVVGVAVGFKYVNNVKTNELSIVVDVSQKVPEEDLNVEDVVPPLLEGIKTDVIETGSIQAYYDPTQKFRPAPGGVSIGHKNITAGTLGIVVVQSNTSPSPYIPGETYCSIFGVSLCPVPEQVSVGKVYILSNNHVLANSNNAEIGDAIYQPGSYDGGSSGDTIAYLSKYIPIEYGGQFNKVDCALAESINPGEVVERTILEIGEISGSIEAELGMLVRKYGRTTQLTLGSIIQIHATVDVGGYPGGIARFKDQIITGVMAAGGDSGSLLVEQGGNRAVGLLFAGSSIVTVFNRIANVEEALEIKI